MIIYYALGGGLGHLVRARAFLQTRHSGKEALIITASPRAQEFSPITQLRLVGIPPSAGKSLAALLAYLQDLIERIRPQLFYVDAFPKGLFGELPKLKLPSQTSLRLVARILKFEEYERSCGPETMRFERSFLCEPLSEAQIEYLSVFGGELREQRLEEYLSEGEAPKIQTNDFWLVDHSGSEEEVSQLLEHARTTQRAERVSRTIIVNAACCPGLATEERHINSVHSQLLYAKAEHVITAAGFNAVRQGRRLARRHSALAFPRRFDDQRLRLQLAAENSE